MLINIVKNHKKSISQQFVIVGDHALTASSLVSESLPTLNSSQFLAFDSLEVVLYTFVNNLLTQAIICMTFIILFSHFGAQNLMLLHCSHIVNEYLWIMARNYMTHS